MKGGPFLCMMIVLTQLQMYDFALQEAALFLNSHPHDKEALSYYRTMQCCSKQAREEYEALHGPLTNRDNNSCSWEYIHGKWPWEGDK